MRYVFAVFLAGVGVARAGEVTLDVSGRLLAPTGDPVADGAHTLEVRVVDAAVGGTVVWVGTVAIDTQDGRFAAEVGAGTPPLDSTHLVGDRWIEYVIDPPAAPLSPRKRLTAVPRAVSSEVTSSVRVLSVAPTCGAAELGSLYFDDVRSVLRVCATDGGAPGWVDLATAVRQIRNTGAYRAWSDGTYAASCKGYRNPNPPDRYAGDTGDGVYRIQPADTPFDVYCDMTTDGGGWTYVAEPGRSRTDPTDTYPSVPYDYHRYRYDLAGMTFDEVLVVRPAGFYWCNSWGGNSTAWTHPGTTSMGIAYDREIFSYHNGQTNPYAWIQQPYDISKSCSNCWASNNTTPSPVVFTGLDGATGAVVKLDPPGSGHDLLEISNFDAFIGTAGGCNLSAGNQATWQTYIR